MKAPQQRCKPTETDTKVKLGNKIQCLKPGKYTKKSSANVGAKCKRGAGQLCTGSQIGLKGGSFMEVPFSDSKNLSAQPQKKHSEKIKLQLFPIDEAIQKVLQEEEHNPYLELTLAPRKKMSSIVQHLNTKWGSSRCAKGELMLFPYDARLDRIAGSEKWTLNDSCTAADVYVAVGSPSTFRLRYGWFGPNFKEQSSGASLASVHSPGKIIGDKPSDLVMSKQKQMVDLSEFPSKFATPSAECNPEQAVDNQSKVTPLSWIDCISNISFGALLSEAIPSQDSKQTSLQNNSILQQIPVTCDSFDAAIASLIKQSSSQPKVSNPSLWEAEETCHAFPFHNQTSISTSGSVPGNTSAITSPILGAIPESDTDVDQQCSADIGKEEPSSQMSVLHNYHNAKPEFSMPKSTDEAEIGASCSRLLSGTDSLGLSGLLANSLDAFPNFSVS